MKKRNIVLIGPMGTGKSRAAKILADGLDWQLADTDRMMERDTGMKIADFYRDAGAEAFAEKEMQVISRVRYYHEAVIAMGGNYPMTEEKFHLLAEHGVMVLLYAKPYRLAERVRRRQAPDHGLFRCGWLRAADAAEMGEVARPCRCGHQYDQLPPGADRDPDRPLSGPASCGVR